MPATTWIWIRHAATAPGGGFCGRLDVDVVPFHGTVTAELAAAEPNVVLVSPLRRARATADVICAPLGCRRDVRDDLVEQSFGDWEGRDHAAARGVLPDDLEGMAAFRPPAGESFVDVVHRVQAAMQAIEAAHAGKRLWLIAHAGVIRAALAVALGIPAARALGFAVDPLSATSMTSFGGAGWRVDYVNRPACT